MARGAAAGHGEGGGWGGGGKRGLLIFICLLWLWLTLTSFYVITTQDQSDGKSQVRMRQEGSPLSNIWISLRYLDILRSQEMSSVVIERLPSESILVGEFMIGNLFRVSHPTPGWIRTQDQDDLVRIEHWSANFSVIDSEDFCSSTLSLTPASDTIERLLSWQNQWPIGNGKFGTFVGGSYSVNMMPFSLEGFYVGSKTPQVQESSHLQENFNRSRLLLVKGEFESSQQAFSASIRKKPMAVFQSVFDLVLFFSPQPLERASNSQTQREFPNIRSRSEIFFDLQSTLFGEKIPLTSGVVSVPNSQLIFERNFLKTREGVSVSSHVIRTSVMTHHIHSRTWFSSTPDDVIVGKLKCISTPDENGCLNMLIHPTRDKRPSQSASIFRISTWQKRKDYSHFGFKETPRTRIHKGSSIIQNDVIAITASLDRSTIPLETFPSTELCGILHCPRGRIIATGEYLICNSAAEMLIIFHLVAHTGDRNDARETCWTKVETALYRGYEKLLRRHQSSFSEAMHESELCFGIESPTSVEKKIAGVDRNLENFRFQRSNRGQREVDLQLMNSLQWFNKYLLYSAASRSVSNLQGLWADGPTSAWGGDYHFNINLQMTYWPIYGMGISKSLITPFVNFTRRLFQSGHISARELYGCRGWVVHGFTDNSLDTGILGDLEWSLCVTCMPYPISVWSIFTHISYLGGAWLALHLWDYLTYYDDPVFLLDSFLPTFQDLAEFFECYMFLGPDGAMHTGPTTSPENSFCGNTPEQDRFFSQVSFSPAIDMSILRQCCNAYRIAAGWASSDPRINSDPKVFSILQDHTTRGSLLSVFLTHHFEANSFCSLIFRMQNHANPVIDQKSNTIVEYPINRWINSILPQQQPLSQFTRENANEPILLNATDWAHRHFSSLHWLFPGTFIPFTEGDDTIFRAAHQTLHKKSTALGGHTGWSASWESCLWSRLRNSSQAWDALLKVFGSYTSPNLLGLHPPLASSDPLCRTCYLHDFRQQYRPTLRNPSQAKRGLIDENGAVVSVLCSNHNSHDTSHQFQIDSNSGSFAAVSEMLIQSHIFGVIFLLPSLPLELSQAGLIRDWLIRGGVRVSMKWRMGKITSASLLFGERHPWSSVAPIANKKGYFDSSSQDFDHKVTIISPNELRVMNSPSCVSLTIPTRTRNIPLVNDGVDHLLSLQILSHPCAVCLCPPTTDRNNCLC